MFDSKFENYKFLCNMIDVYNLILHLKKQNILLLNTYFLNVLEFEIVINLN